jgi:CRISPR/Cas system-associated exonuclease Cas4 (RecB family)
MVGSDKNWLTSELSDSLAKDIAERLVVHTNGAPDRKSLRLSKLGPVCPRALWYSVHHPELAEPLPAAAKIKYSYGHVLEAMAITMAKAAGHEVTGEQDEVVLDGIVGHRDCVIDGAVVDVKSCSTFQFAKYKTGTVQDDDAFGYLDQLDAYGSACIEDPLVTIKDKAYILAIDKTLGHIALYEHSIRTEAIRARIEDYKEIVQCDQPPICRCGTKPIGVSGNIGLDTKASYSPYKYICFPHLRTFLYSSGPVYLTRVIRRPEVIEVDKYGNPIL